MSENGITGVNPFEIRVAIWTHHSGDKQGGDSGLYQERDCREAAVENGWVVNEDFVRHDDEVSGKSLLRYVGLASLLEAVREYPLPFSYLVVDDTCRFGGNLGEILHLADALEFRGVGLYFVAQKLDSKNESFRTMLSMFDMIVERYIHQLKKKVLRGQNGPVLRSYTPAQPCFGCRSVPKPTRGSSAAIGRAGEVGSMPDIVESEAETIRRIFHMFTDGIGVHQIARNHDVVGYDSASIKSRTDGE